MSVENDDLDFLQFLLSRGADPNINHTLGMARSLEVAARDASIPVIETLMNAGSVVKGRRLLQYATIFGRTDVVAYLLDHGAAIDEIPDNPDLTDHHITAGLRNPLCEAAWRGQTAVLKLLLDRGADASIRDTNGKSALELAETEGHESCVDVLKHYTSS
jgi:ankyrin repeat protein